MKSAKESLYFVAKCLSLDTFPERVGEVRERINNGLLDWEMIVSVSSGELVLPAFYLSLSRHDLLPALPDDLREYLAALVEMNRERNEAILEQLKEIADVLERAAIVPVFLKGSAHLLFGLYADMAERMLGDIDIAVKEAEMEQAAEVLIDSGYEAPLEYDKSLHRDVLHYPRLTHGERVAAIDVHRQLVAAPHHKKFSFELVYAERQECRGLCVPSVEHMLIHNVLNTQINDKARLYGDIHLRQLYDLLLLSEYRKVKEVSDDFVAFRRQMNMHAALASEMFDAREQIGFEASLRQRTFLLRISLLSSHSGLAFKIYKRVVYLFYRVFRIVKILFRAVFFRDEWRGVWLRLGDAKWYEKHLKSYKKS